MTTIDTALQAQVDAQLLEQGAFTALEMLIDSGRLIYADYESWRRREIEFLDAVLMGSKEKIRAQIEQAIDYARGIKLVEQTQEFYAWAPDSRATAPADARAGAPANARTDTLAGANNVGAKPLRISADAQLHRLIASRYVPAQNAPQMDLFLDNPVVALANGIVRALSARNMSEAQRQLDRLYAHAPNHADLAAFDRLLAALGHLSHAIDDPPRELDFLLEITPTAKRLLGSQSRDLLAPLWRQLADTLGARAFSPDRPTLHRSFALSQAQDWDGVSDAVLNESGWWLHAPLCLRLAQSGFYRRRRIEALTAWCHLCWRNPEHAADVLDKRRQPDADVTALWQWFLDSEEECSQADQAVQAESASEPELTAADFPAWMLLHEPALAEHLRVGLPTGNTTAEENYRCVHRWTQARRANQRDEEIAQRKILQASHPALFRYLKQSVSAERRNLNDRAGRTK